MPDTSASRPDVLCLVVDQMQAACLGSAGHPDVRTPNLDRLAAVGTRFSRAYCANPVCSPSRMSMLTGLLPSQHGLITNGQRPVRDQATVTGALAAAGYRTHSVGKLHLEPFMHALGPVRRDRAAWPPDSWEDQELWDDGTIAGLPEGYYGFQTADYLGGHVHYCFGDYARWLEREHPGVRESYRRDHARREWPDAWECWTLSTPRELHYNEWIADRASAFLRDVGPEPFFLWASFPDPHHPFAALPEFVDRYDPAALVLSTAETDASDLAPWLADERRRIQPTRTRYAEADLRAVLVQTYAMIEHVDACAGRILDALDASGRAANTTVVFLADHGEYLGAHHLLLKGRWPLEAVHRVPFIWRGPGIAAGAVRDDVVSLVDLAPTLLAGAGLDPGRSLDRRGATGDPAVPAGADLGLALRGETCPSRPAFIQYDDDGQPGPMLRLRTIVAGRYKLTLAAGETEGILVDLEGDPDERRNRWHDAALAAVRADLVLRLCDGLARHDRIDQPKLASA